MIMIESNTLALSKQYHRHRAALLQDKQKRYQQQWLIQVKKNSTTSCYSISRH